MSTTLAWPKLLRTVFLTGALGATLVLAAPRPVAAIENDT